MDAAQAIAQIAALTAQDVNQQQQLTALNAQLAASAEQTALMAQALDLLRQESGQAIQELRRLLAETRTGHRGRETSFVNTKSFEGGTYGGTAKESYKAWSKKVKVYLNAQSRGMRQALELAEDSAAKPALSDLKLPDLGAAVEINEKLYDFLVTFTAEEAMRLVEPHTGDGFEAWRQLKLRYTLSGGGTEVDRTVRLYSRKACKSMADLPAAIDLLDKEIRKDEETNSHRIPSSTKIALLVQMFPEAHSKELKFRHVHGQSDFEKVRTSILNVAVVERLEQLSRGVKDMEVDHLNQPEETWTTSEWIAWNEKLAHEDDQKKVEADYLGKGGKRGGGKSGGKGKGGGKDSNGKDGKGKGKGKESRVCYWCQKHGHLIADCRAKAAGKPKTKPAVNAASLEEDGEWEEDCSCCDVAADVLGEDSEDSSAESDEEWTVAEDKQRKKQRAAASQRFGNDTDDPWTRLTGDPWARPATQISATSIFEMIRVKQQETKKLV